MWAYDKSVSYVYRCLYIMKYKTNRLDVAVLLFSNRSQMTSKCGKNKKVARGDSRVCH